MTRMDDQLAQVRRGFSFENKYHNYYGLAIRGLSNADRPKSLPVRLFSLSESEDVMYVLVKCEQLEPGTAYAVYRSPSSRRESRPVLQFRAEASVYAFYDKIDKAAPAVYQCVRRTPP